MQIEVSVRVSEYSKTVWTTELVPFDRACKRLATLARGRGIRMHCKQSAPVNDDQFYSVYGTLPASLKNAQEYINENYASVAKMGARVKIVHCDTLVFIG